MNNHFTYAVVGGGIAGVSCVEQILEFDPNANILLISSSTLVKEASNVTRLSKTLQDFIVVEKSLKSFKDVHPSVHVVQDTVQSLDAGSHSLKTVGGAEFSYGKLCICSGGVARRIFQNEFVLGIRDTASVKQLCTAISTSRRIILLGNGGIATEFVHQVEGVEVIWVIKDQSISAHFVDAGAAEFFIQAKLTSTQGESAPGNSSSSSSSTLIKRKQYTLSGDEDSSGGGGSALGPDWHRDLPLKGLYAKKNVEIIYGSECVKISPQNIPSTETETEEGWRLFAELANGRVIGADLIISATGVVPNLSWIGEQCAHDEVRGVFVDEGMLTSAPDVYAAGDVCCPTWERSKHWFQMRLWTQARQMGLFAGKSMYLSYQNSTTSHSPPPPPAAAPQIELDFCFEIFSHVTRFFGFKVVLLGLYNGDGLDPRCTELVVRCTKGMEYVKVVLEGGRMQGALLIGDTGLEETFENLILNQLDLSPYGEDILNPDIDIEDYFD